MAEHTDLEQSLARALVDAVHLLDNARCDLGDPSLRLRWGRERKRLRDFIDCVESDTSSNARPGSAPSLPNWPESIQ